MIIPNWNAPQNIKAFTLLSEDEPLDSALRFLQQVHGKKVVLFPSKQPDPIIADSVITRTQNTLCIIRSADCLPILISNRQGNEVAAIHAGWKGLVAGVIEETFEQLKSLPQDCIAWIGPAICGSCYEVGPEVRETFINKNPHFAAGFTKGRADKYFGDLPKIAEMVLKALGVLDVTLSGICTFEDTRCNSYRRQKGTDQRMLTGISFKA